LPPLDMRSTSWTLNESIVIERTKEMWTPRERWVPEHERQKKMPNLGEAFFESERWVGQASHQEIK